jgi:hypothetical protein
MNYDCSQAEEVVFFKLKSCEQELMANRKQGPTKKTAELETKLQDLSKKESKLRTQLLSLAA